MKNILKRFGILVLLATTQAWAEPKLLDLSPETMLHKIPYGYVVNFKQNITLSPTESPSTGQTVLTSKFFDDGKEVTVSPSPTFLNCQFSVIAKNELQLSNILSEKQPIVISETTKATVLSSRKNYDNNNGSVHLQLIPPIQVGKDTIDRVYLSCADTTTVSNVEEILGHRISFHRPMFVTYYPKDKEDMKAVNNVSLDFEGNIYSSVLNFIDYDVNVFFIKSKNKNMLTSYGMKVNGYDVISTYVDHNGNLYIGENNKLTIKYKNKNEIVTYTTADGLAGSYVRDIYVDTQGTLYVATQVGVSIKTKDQKRFTTYTADHGLPDGVYWSVYADAQGTIYIGTDFAISIKHNDQDVFRQYKANGSDRHVDVPFFVDTNGTVYMRGVEGILIKHKDQDEFSQCTINGMKDKNVISINVDSKGTIYAGTKDGLSIKRKDQEQFTTYTTDDGLGGNVINSVVVDAQGTLYAGTENGLSISTTYLPQ